MTNDEYKNKDTIKGTQMQNPEKEKIIEEWEKEF